MANGRLWTEEEDDILRRHFPLVGVDGCMDLLDRSRDAINHRAFKLRLKSSNKAEYRTMNRPELPPIDTRDLTARFFGDPLPGRSALDRMRAA